MDVDLLVLGAGMAGLTAAARAATAGLRVLVVEKQPVLGGSALVSGGHLWTTPTVEGYAAENPGGDRALGTALVEGFPAAVDWVRSTGAWVSDELTVLGYGRGYRIDIGDYLARCAAIVRRTGGWVLPSRTVHALRADGGAVTGAVVSDVDGTVDVTARETLLATGGFQASDTALRAAGLDPDAVVLRAAAGSTGDGLRLGLAAGATVAGPMTAFYGHLVGWPLPRYDERDFVRFSLFQSPRGLLLDRHGRRFTDESLADHRNAQAVSRVAGGRALLLMDAEAHAAAAATPAATNMIRPDPIGESASVGARCVTAGTLAEVAAAVTAWGFDGGGLLATVAAYNEGVRDPARTRYGAAVATPPLFAIEVRAGITMTHGGLRIGPDARVLDAAGRPVPGLLAAGVDAGGLNDGGYAGGLAAAAVFGSAAAELAAAVPA
jgi:succinate dehydrogenase/fumarate reductase flavoprotein subunit